MKNTSKNPPLFLVQFFRWYCHPDMADYIEGDLMEVYNRRLKSSGKRNADWKFFIDVLFLFRPGIIKPNQPFKSLTNYSMLKNYFKIGWRNLIRNKEYSIINIGGLALSITCCILIYGLVKSHYSTDNFHDNSERIFRVVTELKSDSESYLGGVPTPLASLIRENETFEEKISRIFTANNVLIAVSNSNGLQFFRESEGVAFVEPEFFEIFNFPLVNGNIKSLEDTYNAVFLTQEMAYKFFGVENPIGKSIVLDQEWELTVAGVLKDFPKNSDFKSGIYISFKAFKSYKPWLADENFWNGISTNMQCFLLIREGYSPFDAEQSLVSYGVKYPISPDTKNTYKLQQLSDIHFNKKYGATADETSLWVLSGIGFFLLLTACLNFINLATARALRRSKEVGLRKVLGGLRSQLFWQFIYETGIIVSLSIFSSLVISSLLLPTINNWFEIQLDLSAYLNLDFLCFLLILVVSITLLAGFYPSIILGGFSPIQAIRGKSGQLKVGGFNTRRSLIVTQFVISQVLVLSLLVVMQQLKFATQSDLGFNKEATILVNFENDSLPLRNSLKEEFLRIPGVLNVSLCEGAPISNNVWRTPVNLVQNSEESDFNSIMKMVDEDYIETFDLHLIGGRNLTHSDTVREVLVNEAFLKKLGISSVEDVLGQKVSANGGNMIVPIVGVVKNFHDNSFKQEINPMVITSDARSFQNFAVRLDMKSGMQPIMDIEKVWEKNLPETYFEYSFLDDDIARFYDSENKMLKGIQLFSFIAIILGCLGLYGLVSFMVVQKTKEIGIRKVLGGTEFQILWIFGKEFVSLTVIAFALAAPLGMYLMNLWLQSFEYKIQIGLALFGITIFSSLLITILTVGYQVLRASFVNPANSLQSE